MRRIASRIFAIVKQHKFPSLLIILMIAGGVWAIWPVNYSEAPSLDGEGIYFMGGSQNPNRRGDVIFVHGLNGNYRTTWKSNETGFSWPEELAREIPDVGVWSFSYDSAASDWLGAAMPIVDRSKNFLSQIVAEKLGRGNTIFVVHSLGGLVVKQALMHAITLRNDDFEEIADNTKAVIFLGTPHTGSGVSNFMQAVSFGLRLSVNTEELGRNEAPLRDLNVLYRNNIPDLGIMNYGFFETKKIGFLWWSQFVVDQGSADPGINNVTPIGISANHFTICKPKSSKDLAYASVRDIVNGKISPNPPRFDISFEDFVSKFNEVRDDPEAMRMFVDQHVGQKVTWKATIQNVNPGGKQPSLTISTRSGTVQRDFVTAVFSRLRYPGLAIGSPVTIEGAIGKATDDLGVVIIDCRLAK
ncbi:MAG: esterase/lipase family protein [Gemmataceae bacterium]